MMKEKNIRELAKRMGLITVENMCQYTITQLVVMVANKVNELVDEVWRFETDVQEILKTQNENIQYLLGEGLHLEVATVFERWVEDGTFDTLINQTALKKVNDRIDETNAQLSNISLTPEMFGAKGDGITDDTDAINNCLNQYGEVPTKITFTKNYLVKNKLFVPSNTIIDFNGGKILWGNTDNQIQSVAGARQHWSGVLNCHGSLDETKKYQITKYTVQSRRGKFTIGSHSLEVNDYIAIDIPRQLNTVNDYIPSMQIMARITDIGSDYVITDYRNPLNWRDFVYSEDCTITKINEVKNITFNNVEIENTTSMTNPNINNSLGTEMDVLACGIGIYCGADIYINNLKGYRIQLPLAIAYYGHNIHIDTLKNIDPTHLGGAQGYAVKMARVFFGTANRVFGKGCRHLIDFSDASSFTVTNSKGIKTYAGDFDLHGCCEHDITFENCEGDFAFGNDMANSFPSIMKNVTMTNCKGRCTLANVENLMINSCDLQYINQSHAGDAIHYANISNSRIGFESTGDYTFVGGNRGGKITPTLKLNNVEFYSSSTGTEFNMIFKNFDTVKLSDSDVSFRKNKVKLTIENVDNMTFKGVDFNGILFSVRRTDGGRTDIRHINTHYLMRKEDFWTMQSNERDVLGLNDTTNGTVNIAMNGCVFELATNSVEDSYILFETLNKANCNFNIESLNSKFKTSTSDTVKVIIDKDAENYNLSFFNCEFSKKITNHKDLWVLPGNKLNNVNDGDIIATTNELRIQDKNGNGIGIAIDDTGTPIFKKIQNNTFNAITTGYYELINRS